MNNQRFFVLSSGRAGSRSITESLDQFSNCSCRHHPEPEPIEECSNYWRGLTNGDELREILHGRMEEKSNEAIGEVNLQWSLATGIIAKLIPLAKYVWLIRDGRDVVASMYGRGWYDSEVDPIKRPRWNASRLQGDQPGRDLLANVTVDADYTPDQWKTVSRFEKCCWAWRTYNRIIEKTVGRTDACFFVRLHELDSSMQDLANFLELEGNPPDVRRLNVAKQNVVYWRSWDKSQVETFERICSTDMTRWIPEWKHGNDWKELEYDSNQRRDSDVQHNSFWQKLRKRLRRVR